MTWIFFQFEDQTSIQKLKSLILCIFQLVESLEEGDKEDQIKEIVEATLWKKADVSSEILTPYLNKIIDWYIKEPSAELTGIANNSLTFL